MKMKATLHKNPYSGPNSKTIEYGRAAGKVVCARQWKVQSVPMFKKNKKGEKVALLGFRYIYHD